MVQQPGLWKIGRVRRVTVPRFWAPAAGWGGAAGLTASPASPASLPLPRAAEGDGMRWEDGCGSAAPGQRWRRHSRAGRAASPQRALPGWESRGAHQENFSQD